MSSVKLAATVQQTLSEMQVGGFPVLCSFSTSLKARQAIFVPVCRGIDQRTKGKAHKAKLKATRWFSSYMRRRPWFLIEPLPRTHFEQWLSTACPNRWIIRSSAVGLYRSNCLLIIHDTLGNTVLAKDKICGGISAFWQSSLGLRYHAGFSFLYEH